MDAAARRIRRAAPASPPERSGFPRLRADTGGAILSASGWAKRRSRPPRVCPDGRRSLVSGREERLPGTRDTWPIQQGSVIWKRSTGGWVFRRRASARRACSWRGLMADERDLIAEIRSVRRRLWQEHGGTVEGFAAWLREREAQHPELMAAPPSAPPRALGRGNRGTGPLRPRVGAGGPSAGLAVLAGWRRLRPGGRRRDQRCPVPHPTPVDARRYRRPPPAPRRAARACRRPQVAPRRSLEGGLPSRRASPPERDLTTPPPAPRMQEGGGSRARQRLAPEDR